MTVLLSAVLPEFYLVNGREQKCSDELCSILKVLNNITASVRSAAEGGKKSFFEGVFALKMLSPVNAELQRICMENRQKTGLVDTGSNPVVFL